MEVEVGNAVDRHGGYGSEEGGSQVYVPALPLCLDHDPEKGKEERCSNKGSDDPCLQEKLKVIIMRMVPVEGEAIRLIDLEDVLECSHA